MSEFQGPLLIFGSPRSGTTWLAKILDSHPETLYSHEPDSALPPADIPLFLPLGDIEVFRGRIADWVDHLKFLRSVRVSAKLPLFPKSYRKPLLHFLFVATIMGTKAASRRNRELRVPLFASRSALETSRWIWKSIESLGRLGGLSRTIPGCRAVLLIRHPCGVVSSILRGESSGKFTSEVPASEDRGIFELLADTREAKERRLDLKAFLDMPAIDRLTWRWALTNEKAMNDTAGLSNVMVVRYEDLCADPLAIARKILSFGGLPWHAQVENFLQASTSSKRSAYYGVFKDPRESAMKWMRELGDNEIGRVMDEARGTAPGKLFLS